MRKVLLHRSQTCIECVVEKTSPILRTRCSFDVPLVPFPNGGIAAEHTRLSDVPQRSASRQSFFCY